MGSKMISKYIKKIQDKYVEYHAKLKSNLQKIRDEQHDKACLVIPSLRKW